MGLADDLAAIPQRRLSTEEILDQLDAKDRAAVDAALANRRVSTSKIHAVLIGHGIDVGESALSKYRASL